MIHKNIILDAGMTGLIAGFISGLPIYKAKKTVGCIKTVGYIYSLYILPWESKLLSVSHKDDDAYRFELKAVIGPSKNILQLCI